MLRVDLQDLPRGEHHRDAREVVDHQAPFATAEADAATEREARDADRGARAGRQCHALFEEPEVRIDIERASTDLGGHRPLVDARRRPAEERDNEALARRLPDVAMATAARHHRDFVGPGPLQREAYVVARCGHHHCTRTQAVEVAVAHLAQHVIPRVGGRDEAVAQALS